MDLIKDIDTARFITMAIHQSIDTYINVHGNCNGCTIFITPQLIELLNAYLVDSLRVFSHTTISSIWGVPVVQIPMDGMRYWIGEEFEWQ